MNVVAIEGEHEDIARRANADATFNCELGESREVFNESMVAEENDFTIASAAFKKKDVKALLPDPPGFFRMGFRFQLYYF